MKGIILAGGTGSRLFPLTKVTNKHLLPVGKYPMIFYPVFKLKQAGITEILIVTGKEDLGDVVNLLGSGREMNVTFTYKVQEDKIVSIEEKLQYPKSNYAVTGIYLFDNTVFDIVKTLKPSDRGELEITDVNNAYIERNELTFDILNGWWTDAGTHESLVRANELAKDLHLEDNYWN
ncbi:sugar phosphate nucleotidyltransferase [Paenibacillus glycanilyticus]|uniref:sugar phosphate nucleotidyltransferase n=1 Tax=Paenibacillus glycanilyticus TaxID=126569 RepID=UPI00203EE707|nr:sugar phosphate nucleotidyltransferase [Paenibacillus glycanilyticus]MCM3629991.1 sugar phosphate nucleotidyltransferase [Paenibacillus glycanilyticus]